jgi:hypothetical protein
LGQNHTVLERWVSEQAQGALESIEASRKVLGLLRQDVALTRVVQRHSMSLLLRVNAISWALSKGHTTIVQGELQVRCWRDMVTFTSQVYDGAPAVSVNSLLCWAELRIPRYL